MPRHSIVLINVQHTFHGQTPYSYSVKQICAALYIYKHLEQLQYLFSQFPLLFYVRCYTDLKYMYIRPTSNMNKYTKFIIHIFHVNSFHLNISTKKNSLRPYMRQRIGSSLIQVMACPRVWRQATAWTNAELSIEPSWTNLSQILIEIQTFSFKKMHLKISSSKYRSFGLGLNFVRTICFCCYLWKPIDVLIPTSSTMVAPKVAIGQSSLPPVTIKSAS